MMTAPRPVPCLFVGMLLLAACCSATPVPGITLSSVDANPNEGMALVFSIAFSNTPSVASLSLEFGGRSFNLAPPTFTNGVMTVTLSNVSPAYAGNWQAKATLTDGTVLLSNVVIVTIQSKPLACTASFTPASLNEGENMTLTVMIQGAATQIWLQNGLNVYDYPVSGSTFKLSWALVKTNLAGTWNITLEDASGERTECTATVDIVPLPLDPSCTAAFVPGEINVMQKSNLSIPYNDLDGDSVLLIQANGVTIYSGNVVLSGDGTIRFEMTASNMGFDGTWLVTITGTYGTVTCGTELKVNDGIDIVTGCGNQYRYYTTKHTYADSKTLCESHGLFIATPFLQEEIIEIMALVSTKAALLNPQFYSGFTYSGTEWTDVNCNTASLYQNITYNGKVCTCVEGVQPIIQNAGCDMTMGVLCQARQCDVLYKVEHASTYIAIDKKLAQPQAQAYCQAVGGELSTMTHPQEMQIMCEPLVELGLLFEPFWQSYVAQPNQSFLSACGSDFPAAFPFLWPGLRGSVTTTKRCTTLVEDIHAVDNCEVCNRFFCEIQPCLTFAP